jgi:hypothetical protein
MEAGRWRQNHRDKNMSQKDCVRQKKKKKKINKETSGLKGSMETDVTDVYRIFHSAAA